jgi:hypothetical protein
MADPSVEILAAAAPLLCSGTRAAAELAPGGLRNRRNGDVPTGLDIPQCREELASVMSNSKMTASGRVMLLFPSRTAQNRSPTVIKECNATPLPPELIGRLTNVARAISAHLGLTAGFPVAVAAPLL